MLRAKGIVQGEDAWYYFDVTPQEYEIRTGAPTYAGRYCVIGAQLQEEALRTLFEGEKPKKDMQEDASFTIEVD